MTDISGSIVSILLKKLRKRGRGRRKRGKRRMRNGELEAHPRAILVERVHGDGPEPGIASVVIADAGIAMASISLVHSIGPKLREGEETRRGGRQGKGSEWRDLMARLHGEGSFGIDLFGVGGLVEKAHSVSSLPRLRGDLEVGRAIADDRLGIHPRAASSRVGAHVVDLVNGRS